MYKFTCTPKFSTQEIMDSTINKDWFIFQADAFELGQKLTAYMQNYINTNRKRPGTGNLANAIQFYGKTGAGYIEWGIGKLSILNRRAKYWYVLNFGATTTGKRFVPPATTGNFEGSPPNSSLIGRGTQRFFHDSGMMYYMQPKVPIRPINYIQASQHKLGQELSKLLAKTRQA